MSRINTNVQSMIAQRVLNQNHKSLNVSLERLSTGVRINRGKDDPAGLIASEALGSEIKSTGAALSNAERADQVVNTAEGGLQEVSGLLTELQGLVTNTASTAGLSPEEKDANQLQVDSILQTIDRISGSTSFQGIKLLNGNFDFKVSGMAAGVADFRINAAKFSGGSMNLNAVVTKSAQLGGVYLSMATSNISLSGTGLTNKFVIEVKGSKGARELSFTSGTNVSVIRDTINTFKDVTGVSASKSGTGVRLYSTDYGSSEFVSIKVVTAGNITGTGNGVYNMSATNFNRVKAATHTGFASATNGVTDAGQDVGATINGIIAVGKGRTAKISTDFLDAELTFAAGTANTLGSVGGAQTGTITGGGATFQLAGKVDINGKVSLGVGDTSIRRLGTSTLGFLSSLSSGNTNSLTTTNLDTAQKIVSEAVNQVSSLRGRLGAFQKNVVGATTRSLGVALENSQAAQSVIRDSDFAAETASLTRNQIMVSASSNVLGLANQSPQSVLQLLG